MRNYTLDTLPVTAATRAALRRPGIDGAFLGQTDTYDTVVVVWGPGCTVTTEAEAAQRLPGAWGCWRRVPTPAATPKRSTRPAHTDSRTQRAVALVQAGEQPRAAAAEAGVDVSAVYRALRRLKRPVCKCCGQYLPSTTGAA